MFARVRRFAMHAMGTALPKATRKAQFRVDLRKAPFVRRVRAHAKLVAKMAERALLGSC